MAKPPSKEKPTEPEADAAADASAAPKKRSKKLLIGAPVVAVLLIGGGLWFTGVIPKLLHGHKPVIALGPVFIKLPEIVANLNTVSGQDSYAKLEATLELGSGASAVQVRQDMPRVMDVFQTYLRAMHPSELRGASGTYRLREALINRVRIAVAPNKVRDVLFEELIVQ